MRDRHVAMLETACGECKIAASWLDEVLSKTYLSAANISGQEDSIIRAERAASEACSRLREVIRRVNEIRENAANG